MNKSKAFSTLATCLVAVSLAIIIFVFCTAPFTANRLNAATDVASLRDGWSLLLQDGTLQPVTMPYTHKQTDTAPFTLTYTLPHSQADTLLLTAYYCNTQILLDGAPIYSYQTSADCANFKTDGKVYMLVSLPDNSGGKVLTVTYTPQFGGLKGYRLDTPLLGDKTNLIMDALADGLPHMILMFILLLLGIGLMVYHFINTRNPRYDGNMLYLGLFCVLCVCYLTLHQRWIHLIYPSHFALYVIEFLSHGTLIMPMLLILRNITKGINHKLINAGISLCMANLFVQLVLYFFTPVELRQMLLFSHLTMIITLPIIMGILLNPKGMITTARLEIIYSLVPLGIFGALDIALHYLFPNTRGGFFYKLA
ncbi:MAG: hypothetical protein PHG02_00295 [Oscillospiraceae bacterium]|nr:hypothetical protein [Oscillospiraceae bacterium]